MRAILRKLIKNEVITEKDLSNALYEICENTHASCDEDCPVYRANGYGVPNNEKSRWGCDCFKDGFKMLQFLKEHE